MNEKYNVYLVSDSTGETLDRIFLSLKSQFANCDFKERKILSRVSPVESDTRYTLYFSVISLLISI